MITKSKAVIAIRIIIHGIITKGLNNQNHDNVIISKKFKNSNKKYTTHISKTIAFISALLYFNFFNIFICF